MDRAGSSNVQQPGRPTPDPHRSTSPLWAASTAVIDRPASALHRAPSAAPWPSSSTLSSTCAAELSCS